MRITLMSGVLVAAACGDNLPANIPPDACATLVYADKDGDGFGDPEDAWRTCDAPAGFVADKTDCDDAAAGAHPGATEACGNGLDDDCAGDGDTLCFAERDGWRITSGPIEPGATSELIKATVTFTMVSGTATTRAGGACLVADLVAQGIGAATCTSDADCIAAAQAAFPTGGYGYCAAPDGSGEAKRCWTRPSDNCVRSPMNPPGSRTLPEVPWDARGNQAPVRWMVLGCLAEQATPAACAGTDPSKYVRSHGPATAFP